MQLKENWKSIQKHFNQSFRSSLHVSIATLIEENNPNITPIGTFFLNDNQSGFYFEKFTKNLDQSTNNKVCILGVNSSKLFWLQSLIKVKFESYPGLKLYGELGDKRLANKKELFLLKSRMKKTSFTKGNKYLWGDMKYVREVKITKAEKINIGKMTKDL